MVFFFEDSHGARLLVRAPRADRYGLSFADLAALLLVAGAAVLVFHGASAWISRFADFVPRR